MPMNFFAGPAALPIGNPIYGKRKNRSGLGKIETINSAETTMNEPAVYEKIRKRAFTQKAKNDPFVIWMIQVYL